MKHVYDILDVLRDELRSNPSVNTVSYGDIMDLDLDKTTMFPLSHLLIDNASYGKRTITFRIKVLCADVVDYNQVKSEFDDFYGNDNLHDVMNTQFQVINSLIMKLMRGDLFNSKFQITSTPTAEPFKESYGNVLAGWTTDIDVEMPNSISICSSDVAGSVTDGSGETVVDYGVLPLITAHSTNFILLDSPFTYIINARNSPTSYSATGLIAGLTIDTATGIITGQLDASVVITVGLSFSVTISATNEIGTETRDVVFVTTDQTSGVLLPPYDLTISSTEGVSVVTSFRLRDYDGVIAGAEVYRQGLLHDTVYFTGNESEFSARLSVTSIDNDGEYTYKVRVFNSSGVFSDFTDEVIHDSVFSGSLNISTNESVVKTNPTLADAVVYCKFNDTDVDPLINLADNTSGQWLLTGSRNYESSGLIGSSLNLGFNSGSGTNYGQMVTFPNTYQFITGNTHENPTVYNNSEDFPFSVSIWFKIDIPTTPEIVNIPLFGADNGGALGTSFGAGISVIYENGVQKFDTSKITFSLTDYRTIDEGVGKEKRDYFDLKTTLSNGWNHVCITYSGAPNDEVTKPIRIYLNNQYYGGVFNYFRPDIKYFGMTNNPTNLSIGSASTSQYKPKVEYDEFSMFKRMLTKDEVNFLYNDGLGQSIV